MTNRALVSAIALVAAVGAASCTNVPRLPSWLGGGCRLEGTIVEDDLLQPAVARRPVGRMSHPIAYLWPKTGTRVTIRMRVDETGQVTGTCVEEGVDPALADAVVKYITGERGRSASFAPYKRPDEAPFIPARLDGRDVPTAATISVGGRSGPRTGSFSTPNSGGPPMWPLS